ncbi:MAG TPA: F0F1 ATP synthase subunit A [Rudaea sp.]|nr:F0F1 ATP synthase subunit A [Rudaea sp.]
MNGAAIVWQLGPFGITTTVLTTWVLMAALTLVSWMITRRLSLDPGRWQSMLEGIVVTMQDAIEAILPGRSVELLPLIGTLWLYLVCANLVGLIPEQHSPTAEISVTAGLALVVFFASHWFGIRSDGLMPYLRHYLSPSVLLLPFNLISELTRTLALAVRLFGNMMSLELAALLVLLVAGLLVPVPLLLLHVVEALVQAYIFGVLALVYIAGGIESQPHPEGVKAS